MSRKVNIIDECFKSREMFLMSGFQNFVKDSKVKNKESTLFETQHQINSNYLLSCGLETGEF